MSDRPYVDETVMECPKCGQTAYFSREYLPANFVYQTYVYGGIMGPCIVRQCEFCRYRFSHKTKDGEEAPWPTSQPQVPEAGSPAARSPYPRRMVGRRSVPQ